MEGVFQVAIMRRLTVVIVEICRPAWLYGVDIRPINYRCSRKLFCYLYHVFVKYNLNWFRDEFILVFLH